MKNFLHRLARWLRAKVAPPYLPAPATPPPLDFFRRVRPPTADELLQELKSTAWTCASINAAVCAAFPPRLYVQTAPSDPAPRCLTRGLDAATQRQLRSHARVSPRCAVEEVVDHPLLTLLRQVNPVHNALHVQYVYTTMYSEGWP